MQIIRHRKIEQDDWRRLPDSADWAGEVDIPAVGRVFVPLAALLQNPGIVLNRNAPTGVLLRPADNVRELEAFLDKLSLVAIEFSAFSEGRCYSQARILRRRYRFTGELRAVGDVSRDRLSFMERCGIDAFELRPGESIDAALSAFTEISVRYQPAEDQCDPIPGRRAARATGPRPSP